MLLRVEGLGVSFSTRHGEVTALHGIDLEVARGETLGVVGESGSGKSVMSLAVMRLLDRAGGSLGGGWCLMAGCDACRAGELRRLRGSAMSMIFQNPRAALNPIRTVQQQIGDVLRAHGRLEDERRQVLALLRAC